jgi:hypothetical protein
MNVSINTVKLTRPLYDWEIAMAAPIFGHALQFRQVRVHEFAAWPDQIDDIGRKLKKMDPRAADVHNAITLFNGCNFPVGLPLQQPALSDPEYYKTGWLMHELTHSWQFQKMGIRYLFLAVQAQFREGANVYDFGGAKNLVAQRTQPGWKIFNFNLEQQAEIVKSYYLALDDLPRQQEMYDACLPYIQDVQASAK